MQPFRAILFAADFSADSKETFRMACSLASEQGPTVGSARVGAELGRGGASLLWPSGGAIL